ncbi:MAG: hypothetical protein KGJ79_03085 [Alphaproteobacteria bacterium]|nr:hypothetical protein [Alphaproteobacteria bacterium]MDE2495127.1 hypothetical protein [Alphaproteobacteria bacterium]
MKFYTVGIPAFFASASLIVGIANAGDAPILGKGSHAQQIVERALAAHRNIKAITLYAKVTGASSDVVVASNRLSPTDRASTTVQAVLKSRTSRYFTRGDTFYADLPQIDMQRKPVGALSLELSISRGETRAEMERDAVAIRDELARRISYEANLVQAAQIDSNVPTHSYAQHLVDVELQRHPDVLILAIHAETPKNSDPEILASNIGRIGKKADDDDMRVVRDGKTNLEVNKELQRYEVELPLNDVSGVRLGALGVVFPLNAHTNLNARHDEAIHIRDEISRRILTPANLVESWPYDPHFSDNTFAQMLVDKTLASHPDVQVIGLHVTPPDSKTNIILASNIGRIGKVADSDDMGVANTGKPNMAVNEAGDRFETELALHDRSGKQIGAISIVYGYAKGDDKTLLARKAQAIADEVSRQISSAAALFAQAN